MLHNKILTIVYILFAFIAYCKSKGRRNDLAENTGDSLEYDSVIFLADDSENCWITLNARAHYLEMDKLEETYKYAIENFNNGMNSANNAFDVKLLQAMLSSRGRVSGRRSSMNDIPAGLNLGGYCMMRMEKSVLFFHRMKLRNKTRFRINHLRTDLREMQIVAQLSLNDLHLAGGYERAITDNDPSVLYYAPTYGLVEMLLRNVEYKMEGRMRILEDSLFIVLVNSEINFYDAIMTYKNNASHHAIPIPIAKKNIEEFVDRMKSDLDEWLRDYFNEHLIFFTEVGSVASIQYRKYEKTKTTKLNEYVDDSIIYLKRKLSSVNSTSVKLPSFSISSITGMEIKLMDGVLRGLDSMYRRSIATGKKNLNIRTVDAIVGFSSLKVIYKYMAFLTTGVPPLSGVLILSADELSAHMAISLMKEPETVDLKFDFIQQLKPESLTIEGPANRMIANFKHILEYHIISMMSNTLMHNIRALRTLTRCQPEFFGHVDADEPFRKKRPGIYQSLDKKGQSNKGKKSADYIVLKEDSIEVELPPNEKGETKKVHLALVENLNITNLNK